VTCTRRDLLRAGGAGIGALDAATGTAEARTPRGVPAPDAVAMLYDTTSCIGCKSCVHACRDANDLPPDTAMAGGVWDMPPGLSTRAKNVIQLYRDDEKGLQSFVKRQCMHCLDPACVSGCPFNALEKGDKGIVTWDPARCIGCRYCEISCPYEVPKFEWDRFNPKIVKCEFCRHLLDALGQPACTKICPTGAVVFGRRSDLLAEAKRRIATKTCDTYHESRVYGEKDGGGTQVLYLSHVPFTAIGLPTLPMRPIPKAAPRGLLGLVKLLTIPVLLYGVFVQFIRRHWKVHDEEARRIEAEQGLKEQL
jgi:Fe-S-cluster-containing dehydrogenase component